MVCYRFFAMATLLGLPNSVVAHRRRSEPEIATCSEQAPCISISVKQDRSVRCDLDADCSFTACVALSTEADGCAKDGDQIDHLCDKGDDASFCPYAGGLWDHTAKTKEKEDTANNIQCQTGGPGEELKFLYKDGEGCDRDGETGTQLFFEDGNNYTVSCGPSTDDVGILS